MGGGGGLLVVAANCVRRLNATFKDATYSTPLPLPFLWQLANDVARLPCVPLATPIHPPATAHRPHPRPELKINIRVLENFCHLRAENLLVSPLDFIQSPLHPCHPTTPPPTFLCHFHLLPRPLDDLAAHPVQFLCVPFRFVPIIEFLLPTRRDETKQKKCKKQKTKKKYIQRKWNILSADKEIENTL